MSARRKTIFPDTDEGEQQTCLLCRCHLLSMFNQLVACWLYDFGYPLADDDLLADDEQAQQHLPVVSQPLPVQLPPVTHPMPVQVPCHGACA